jgi:hypothetical protein
MRLIAYCSRQLNSAEPTYSVTELELLPLLFATKQFRCYLYGRKFIVHKDHRALKWLLNLQDPSSRLSLGQLSSVLINSYNLSIILQQLSLQLTGLTVEDMYACILYYRHGACCCYRQEY